MEVASLLFVTLAASTSLGLVAVELEDTVDVGASTVDAILAFLPWDSFYDNLNSKKDMFLNRMATIPPC